MPIASSHKSELAADDPSGMKPVQAVCSWERVLVKFETELRKNERNII